MALGPTEPLRFSLVQIACHSDRICQVYAHMAFIGGPADIGRSLVLGRYGSWMFLACTIQLGSPLKRPVEGGVGGFWNVLDTSFCTSQDSDD
jgi:hypothetical protein